MREDKNISEVASLKPDYMGFIFYAKSPRYVGEDFKTELPASVQRVGVFVNETTQQILNKVAGSRLDYVQLHGEESVAQCRELKHNNIKVIKVFSVDDEFDFEKTKPYKKAVDYFLFDTKGKFYGGNAVAFDWNILLRYDQEVPFFLSGGLGAANIEDVKGLKAMNIHAVDLNSGVEERPAVKDISKILEVKKKLNSIS